MKVVQMEISVDFSKCQDIRKKWTQGTMKPLEKFVSGAADSGWGWGGGRGQEGQPTSW